MNAVKLFALLVFCTVAIIGLEWFITRGALTPTLGAFLIVYLLCEKAKELKSKKN